jgi:hypothetical protein
MFDLIGECNEEKRFIKYCARLVVGTGKDLPGVRQTGCLLHLQEAWNTAGR